MFEISRTQASAARSRHSCFRFASCFALGGSCLLAFAVLAGCGAPVAEFRRYETYAHKVATSVGLDKGFNATQRQDVDEVMQALFGTPDEPQLPAVEGTEIGKIMNMSRLKIAA